MQITFLTRRGKCHGFLPKVFFGQKNILLFYNVYCLIYRESGLVVSTWWGLNPHYYLIVWVTLLLLLFVIYNMSKKLSGGWDWQRGIKETNEPKLDVDRNRTWPSPHCPPPQSHPDQSGERRQQKQTETSSRSEGLQIAQLDDADVHDYWQDQGETRLCTGSLGKCQQRETGRKWWEDPKEQPL